jgi:hypothetical protein
MVWRLVKHRDNFTLFTFHLVFWSNYSSLKCISLYLNASSSIAVYVCVCLYVRGPFEKFVDSHYYSESKLCLGAVTVSFSKYLPCLRDLVLTTLHPLFENVLQTVGHSEISYLGAPFSWLEKPRNRMGRDQGCMAGVLMGFH